LVGFVFIAFGDAVLGNLFAGVGIHLIFNKPKLIEPFQIPPRAILKILLWAACRFLQHYKNCATEKPSALVFKAGWARNWEFCPITVLNPTQLAAKCWSYMSQKVHQHFNDLSSALKDLHKALLMLEAKKMEQSLGRKVSPYELLHASLNDANLAWLRVMSELIVNIDTVIDETPNLSAQEANKISSEVLEVLEKPPGLIASDFWTRYSDYLGSNPDIIMLHSKVKTVLDLLRPRM